MWSTWFLQAKNENWSGHHFLLYLRKFRNLTKPGGPHIRQHGSANFNFTGGKWRFDKMDKQSGQIWKTGRTTKIFWCPYLADWLPWKAIWLALLWRQSGPPAYHHQTFLINEHCSSRFSKFKMPSISIPRSFSSIYSNFFYREFEKKN